jgi:putative acetyltransferase
VVGNVCFSPVTISDGSVDWYALGPVSVAPERQKRGIGSALIRQGLTMLRAQGAQGCVLVGPPDYYHRFGFQHYDELTMHGVPPEVILALAFGGRMAQGAVTHHAAFAAKAE